MKPFLTLLFITNALFTFGQRFDNKKVNFQYIQFPLVPVKGVSNYNTTMVCAYEQKVQQMKQQHQNVLNALEVNYQNDVAKFISDSIAAENDYQLAAVKYIDDLQKAEVDYQNAMKAYNKHVSTLVATGATNNLAAPKKQFVAKPTKRTVNRPIKGTISEPYYPKIFDWDKLKTNYVQIEGLNELNENAIQVILTFNGIELGNNSVKETKKTTRTEQGDTIIIKKYIGTIQGRHTFKVQVFSPDGTTLMDEDFAGSKGYTSNSTSEMNSRQEATDMLNQIAFLEGLENKIMRNNLSNLKKILNDRFGFLSKSRSTNIRMYFHKKMNYPEYSNAYQSILMAYPNLKDRTSRAALLQHLNAAIQEWENALAQSDLNDKKARINQKVSKFTCLMLAEAYMWKDDFNNADAYIARLKSMNPKMNEKKWMQELEILLASQKRRFNAYNNLN